MCPEGAADHTCGGRDRCAGWWWTRENEVVHAHAPYPAAVARPGAAGPRPAPSGRPSLSTESPRCGGLQDDRNRSKTFDVRMEPTIARGRSRFVTPDSKGIVDGIDRHADHSALL